MIDGQCDKCGKATVYAVHGNGHSSFLVLDWWIASASPRFTHLVCTSCGYTETYVFNKKELAKIAQKGNRIPPEDK